MCIKDTEKLRQWASAVNTTVGKTLGFLKDVSVKLDPLLEVPFVGDSIAEAQDIVYMLNDYYTGKYKRLPVTAIIGGTAALLYLACPIDLIPDDVPILGFIDDAFIINLVISYCLGHELEEYRRWRYGDDEVRQFA